MSVRDGLLAILTLGPAYGLQLHNELTERAPHRRPINVGQVYGTLDRLAKQQLIVGAGATDDGLPLYALTASGRQTAAGWMREPATSALPEWTEMLDQVLISGSVAPDAAMTVARAYRLWWQGDLGETRRAAGDPALAPARRLALLARDAQGVAALAWLTAATAELADYDTTRPLSAVRPRRGRRPNAHAPQTGSRSMHS